MDADERGVLERIIRKLVRFCYLPSSAARGEVLCNKADSILFACILNNFCNALHKLLPMIRTTRYSMGTRSHNRELHVLDYLSKTFS